MELFLIVVNSFVNIDLVNQAFVVFFVKFTIVRFGQLLQLLLSQIVGIHAELFFNHGDSLITSTSLIFLLRHPRISFTFAILGVNGFSFELLLWWWLVSWRRVRNHHTHTRRISSRHLSILLEEACVLNLRVTVSELVLFLLRCSLASSTILLI